MDSFHRQCFVSSGEFGLMLFIIEEKWWVIKTFRHKGKYVSIIDDNIIQGFIIKVGFSWLWFYCK